MPGSCACIARQCDQYVTQASVRCFDQIALSKHPPWKLEEGTRDVSTPELLQTVVPDVACDVVHPVACDVVYNVAIVILCTMLQAMLSM